jgi:hypothetical protein
MVNDQAASNLFLDIYLSSSRLKQMQQLNINEKQQTLSGRKNLIILPTSNQSA